MALTPEQIEVLKGFKAAGITPEQAKAWRPTTEQPENMGVNPDTGTVVAWEPTTQTYNTTPYDPVDWKDYRAGGEGGYGYYENSQGDLVYGKVPENTYQVYDGDGYTTTAGIDPYPTIPTPPALGMADDGYQPIPEGGGTRNPDGSITLPDGSNTSVPNQDIIRDNASGFNSGYVPQRIDWSAVESGGPAQAPAPNVPLQGYESSSNKDFYQQQFANMQADQMRQQGQNAALREQAAQPSQASADPWAWTNLPETVVNENTGTDGFALNSNYGFTPQTTNADIVSSLGPIWSEEEKNLQQGFLQDPGFQERTNWATAGSPQTVLNNLSPDLAPKNVEWITKALNNAYTPAGNAPTPGGFNVPAGYASPVNA